MSAITQLVPSYDKQAILREIAQAKAQDPEKFQEMHKVTKKVSALVITALLVAFISPLAFLIGGAIPLVGRIIPFLAIPGFTIEIWPTIGSLIGDIDKEYHICEYLTSKVITIL